MNIRRINFKTIPRDIMSSILCFWRYESETNKKVPLGYCNRTGKLIPSLVNKKL